MSDLLPLLEAFLGAAGDRVRPSAALEQALRQACAAGHAAWPEISLADATFARHLGRCLRPDQDPDRFLGTVHSGDLYLACACAQGDATALFAFDRAFLSHVPALVARLDRSPAFADEVRQVLRERLLVATDMDMHSPARIADYAGQGALLGWLRVAAMRTALNLRRGPDQQPARSLPDLPAGTRPDLEYLRTRYRQDFRDAVQAALAALSPEQRNAVRLYFISGLSGDEIAAMMGTSRRTAYRWLAQAREAILQGTRRLLKDRLGLPEDEVDSLIALCRSQAELSLSLLLQD